MKKASPREKLQADESEGGVHRERGEKKLDRLLAAAAALMAKQGYDQTTIRHVGRETGFSLAGMYYYFTSKEELLYAIPVFPPTADQILHLERFAHNVARALARVQ